jgi:hypothetical protein
MFEQQLRHFFHTVGDVHASCIARDLGQYVPLMKQYPEIAVENIHRFRSYLSTAPRDNVGPALSILYEIARQVPTLREQIINDLGGVLYEHKALPDNPDAQILDYLLGLLELPVSEHDARLRGLARSVVSLQQPIILIIGAGFSYDTMPITKELSPLLVPLLRDEGVENPVQLLEQNDSEAWRIVKGNPQRFKERFAGRCSASVPASQHEAVAQMLHDGHLTHLISFNWDDLCERAYLAKFGTPISKIITDGISPLEPSLWKLHGDVGTIDGEWVFPYEDGRVFDSLIECLDQSLRVREPAAAVIVGYSETEVVVCQHLIAWLERCVPTILRVRPNWPESDNRGMRDSARRFFQRLNIYMHLGTRERS